jgi:hypothetical protein
MSTTVMGVYQRAREHRSISTLVSETRAQKTTRMAPRENRSTHFLSNMAMGSTNIMVQGLIPLTSHTRTQP